MHDTICKLGLGTAAAAAQNPCVIPAVVHDGRGSQVMRAIVESNEKNGPSAVYIYIYMHNKPHNRCFVALTATRVALATSNADVTSGIAHPYCFIFRLKLLWLCRVRTKLTSLQQRHALFLDIGQ